MIDSTKIGLAWNAVTRPGYFGAKRNGKTADFNARFGAGNWKIQWKVGNEWFCPTEALLLYEDAYCEWFKAHLDKAKLLATTASDVFDDSPTNMRSGLDYSIQETPRSHYQDVAIRRVLLRLGLKFHGTHLVQVRRSNKGFGGEFSPGYIPFHRPELIEQPPLKGWWESGSIEEFWQSNKYLLKKVGGDL